MKIVGIEGACLLVLVLKVQKFTPKNVVEILFLSLSLQPNTSISFVSVFFSLDTNQA
jgi:K+-transporting ATPase A subunit